MYARVLDDWEITSLLDGYNNSKVVKFNKLCTVSGSGYSLKIIKDSVGLIEVHKEIKKIVLPELGENEFGSRVRLKELSKNISSLIEVLDLSKASCIDSVDYLGFADLGKASEDGCIVRLNKEIETIHSKAFIKAKLKSINLNDLKGLKEIGDLCFSDVIGLNEIELGDKLKYLGYAVFAGSSLKRLKIKSDMEITWSSFLGARELESLDIRGCKLREMTMQDKIGLDKLVNLKEVIINKEYEDLGLKINGAKIISV